jgi:Bacterial membrane protein YfhO
MLVSPSPLTAQWLDHVEPDRFFSGQPAFYFYLGLADTDIYLYRPRRQLPPVAWVRKVVGVQSPEEAEKQIAQNILWDLAVVEGAPSQQFVQPGEIDQLVRKPGSWQFETRNSSPGFIRLSEVWHPGWEAKIDGVPTPIFLTNIALIGISIPAGDHHIEVTFTPPRWRLGLFISIGSLLLWTAMLFYWRSRRA